MSELTCWCDGLHPLSVRESKIYNKECRMTMWCQQMWGRWFFMMHTASDIYVAFNLRASHLIIMLHPALPVCFLAASPQPQQAALWASCFLVTVGGTQGSASVGAFLIMSVSCLHACTDFQIITCVWLCVIFHAWNWTINTELIRTHI